jgi:hypothetical protein
VIGIALHNAISYHNKDWTRIARRHRHGKRRKVRRRRNEDHVLPFDCINNSHIHDNRGVVIGIALHNAISYHNKDWTRIARRHQHGKRRKVRRRRNEDHVLPFDCINNSHIHDNRGVVIGMIALHNDNKHKKRWEDKEQCQWITCFTTIMDKWLTHSFSQCT